MSKETKFRAWNSYGKTMDYDPGYDADWERVGLNWMLENSAAFTFMQYTGLKDGTPWEKATPEQRQGYTKESWKGVDIYEGDYIDFRTPEQKADNEHVYLASDDGPPIRLVTYEGGGFEPFATAHNLSEWQSHPKSVDCIVIGNIHENPSLGSCEHSRLTPLQKDSRSQWCCDCGHLFVNGAEKK